MSHRVDSVEVEADKAAPITQDAAGGGSPVETGRLRSGAPGQNFKGHLSGE